METMLLLSWLTLMFVTFTAIASVKGIESTTKFSLTPRLNLNPTKRRYVPCVTKFNTSGICVHESFCNNDHKIEHGGEIHSIYTRSKRQIKECPGKFEWCCSEKNISTTTESLSLTERKSIDPTTVRINKSQRCNSDPGKCPWCVKLYSEEKHGFFCMGAMILPKVILTTATCVNPESSQVLWARVPSSVSPETNYTIRSRIRHPRYNSGTLANDLAILVTEKEVVWGPEGNQACIETINSNQSGCEVAAINDEIIRMIPVSSAGTPGSVGVNLTYDCRAVRGSPIMCPVETGKYKLMGLSKTTCLKRRLFNKILFMNVATEAAWITMTLQEMGL